MQSGFRVGKIFGINIRIDWSWLLILLLITWNMSAVFGRLYQEWGTIQRWAVALSAALLFFVSVLLHELAHSLVARTGGLPVKNITLFLFGGVSNLQREPSSPGKEFWMALVGPLTSIGLGLLLIISGGTFISLPDAMADPLQIMSNLPPTLTILFWLGSVNIFLGLFNLIPGFPLDGGRVLRSIFWALSDNLRLATRWASWVGQGIAWAMIISGIAMVFGAEIPILGTGLVNGMWLVFIGWFLNSAAIQSYQRVVISEALEDVPVENMMRRDIQAISPDSLISDLVYDRIMGTSDRAFPVVESDQLVGLVTLDNVRTVPRSDWDRVLVNQVMTPIDKLMTIGPGEDTAQALNKLIQKNVNQLPVVRGTELLGILRRRDIVRWLKLQSDISMP